MCGREDERKEGEVKRKEEISKEKIRVEEQLRVYEERREEGERKGATIWCVVEREKGGLEWIRGREEMRKK